MFCPNPNQFTTIIAALHFWKSKGQCDSSNRSQESQSLATDCGTIPLNEVEIHELCEELEESTLKNGEDLVDLLDYVQDAKEEQDYRGNPSDQHIYAIADRLRKALGHSVLDQNSVNLLSKEIALQALRENPEKVGDILDLNKRLVKDLENSLNKELNP